MRRQQTVNAVQSSAARARRQRSGKGYIHRARNDSRETLAALVEDQRLSVRVHRFRVVARVDRGAGGHQGVRQGRAAVVGQVRVKDGGDADRPVADEVAVDPMDQPARRGGVADQVVRAGRIQRARDVVWTVAAGRSEHISGEYRVVQDRARKARRIDVVQAAAPARAVAVRIGSVRFATSVLLVIWSVP